MVLPFVPSPANFRRKTGHANQNNRHIAIFGDPLRQQAAALHCIDPFFRSLPISPLSISGISNMAATNL